MKRLLLILAAISLFLQASAQDNKSGIVANPELYIGSATYNEYLPKSELVTLDGPSVKAGSSKFTVYEFTVNTTVNGKPVELYSNNSRFTAEMKEAFGNIANGALLSVKAKVRQPQGVMRMMSINVTIGPKPGNSKFNFVAKLLKGEHKLEAMISQEVILKDLKGTELKKAITDQFGDFAFMELSADQQYELEITNVDAATGKIYLARKNGTIIKEIEKNSSGSFMYKLLPSEHIELQKLEEEDPMLKVLDLKNGNRNEVTVAENILFATGSFEITAEAREKLDKVVKLMKDDPSLLLEVIAHTDSKGDDEANMKLSQSRARAAADHIISQGIEKTRITCKGKGEAELLNRCANNVLCSEDEHQLNRRTEFRFTKKK